MLRGGMVSAADWVQAFRSLRSQKARPAAALRGWAEWIRS
jgi:hypothetical protein